MYYNTENNVLISKSFKTAGSTLYELLNRHVGTSHGVLEDNHYSLELWRKIFNLDKSESTGIVGIRNPWDYVSSAYYWARKNGECPQHWNFEQFVFEESDFNWQKQLEWWKVDEIDDVIVFEDLENEINRVAISHGIPEIVGKPLGHYKKTVNSDLGYKATYYTFHNDTIDYVGDVFKEQIAFFNNKFGVSYKFDG